MKTKIDYKNLLLIVPLLIIMIISFFNMYNAKIISNSYNAHLTKQIIWYFIGFIIFLIIPKIKTKYIFNYSFIWYVISNILLLLVLFFGKEINGAKAWFSLKFFAFQPSELMKLTLCIYLAKIIANAKTDSFLDEFKLIISVIIIVLIPSILVFLEPDTGAIIIYLIITFFLLLNSNIKKRWFIIPAILIPIILITFFYFYFNNPDILIKYLGTSFFYRVERLLSFKENSSLQLTNALVAIGSSSLFGSGFNNVSIYIPEAPTDFAFAFSISNFGIFSGITLILCYLIMDLYLFIIYLKTANKMKKNFILSFIAMFYFQQFENILMNIGLMPIIGIPLPFLSYGGTTILIYFAFLGIIFNLKKAES